MKDQQATDSLVADMAIQRDFNRSKDHLDRKVMALLYNMSINLHDISNALMSGDTAAAKKHCADVGNYAMMIHSHPILKLSDRTEASMAILEELNSLAR